MKFSLDFQSNPFTLIILSAIHRRAVKTKKAVSMKNSYDRDGTVNDLFDREVEDARIRWRDNQTIESTFWNDWVSCYCYDEKTWDDLNSLNRELIRDIRINIFAGPADSLKILDVGSGPLTAVGSKWHGREILTVAVDPLADTFNEQFNRMNVKPPVSPISCAAEELSTIFEENEFDFIWATDSLDRGYNPLLALREMIYVVKPGSIIQLRHKKNSRQTYGGEGIYNWNFDIQNDEFVIWRGNLKIYLQDALYDLCHVKSEEVAYGDDQSYIIVYLKKLHIGERCITRIHLNEIAFISRAVSPPDCQLPTSHTITELSNKFGSDKGTEQLVNHAYSYLYDLLFFHYRDKEVTFLEMGLAVGGPELGNSSVRKVDSPSIAMWLEYFPKAKIYGFDISDFSHTTHERFIFIQGDSGQVRDVRHIIEVCDKFDIVIDDASHASSHQQIALRELYKHVAPGGLYIIEDLHWQSPFYEKTDICVPKTADFLSDLFEKNLYTENELISYEDACFLRYNTHSFSSFPGFKDGIQSTKVIVLRREDEIS